MTLENAKYVAENENITKFEMAILKIIDDIDKRLTILETQTTINSERIELGHLPDIR